MHFPINSQSTVEFIGHCDARTEGEGNRESIVQNRLQWKRNEITLIRVRPLKSSVCKTYVLQTVQYIS